MNDLTEGVATRLDNNLDNQSRLELLVSQLEDFAVILIDKQGHFQTWHPGVERLFGYREDEFVHRHLDMLLPAPDRANGTTARELADALKNGRSSNTRMLVKKDGKEVFVDGVTIALFREDKVHIGFGKVFRDLAERKRAQETLLGARDDLKLANESLERARVEIERSNEELQEFARVASHDLGAPLTTTRWLVDVLESENIAQLDARGKDCVKRIGQGLDLMSSLVQAVLQHAQAGQTAISSSESTSAEEALYRALEDLHSEIALSGAQIVHKSLPDLLIASEPLCRVFQNLVSNALKYRSRDREPVIEISAQRDDGSWRIGVRDNGIGIDPQNFERVFVLMQRLHGPEIPGSGIGLATCKKIVTRAGGRIWVESTPDVGSTFYFLLPGE